MISPASLACDFSRDLLTAAIVDIDTPMLHKIVDMSECTETNPIIIPEDHVLSKTPVIVPNFGNIDTYQGSISDNVVEQSIKRHHPLAKIWFSSIKHPSTATDNIKLQSSRITEKLANIKRSGTLIQHISFETLTECTLGRNFYDIFE